jgi:hypothetical protein
MRDNRLYLSNIKECIVLLVKQVANYTHLEQN